MPDRRWVVAEAVASVDSPERVAMIHPGQPAQAPVILEGSGAAIWTAVQSCAEPVAATVLADQLAIPVAAVEAFLAQLADLGFVEQA